MICIGIQTHWPSVNNPLVIRHHSGMSLSLSKYHIIKMSQHSSCRLTARYTWCPFDHISIHIFSTHKLFFIYIF